MSRFLTSFTFLPPFTRRQSLALTGLCLLITGAPLRAETVTTWTRDQGTAPISGANTTTVVLGDNSNNSANAVYVSGSLSGALTLVSVGDAIQMSGTMIMAGLGSGNISNSITFGLYDTNASANATGWLGYTMGNGDTTHVGSLLERNAGNTTIYGSTAGATEISTALASADLASGTYSFSMTLTRQAANAVNVSYSLTGIGYSMTGSFADSTVNSFNVNRVGFVSDSSGADQFTLSNVSVTYTAIPEPGSAALLICGALAMGLRRRR